MSEQRSLASRFQPTKEANMPAPTDNAKRRPSLARRGSLRMFRSNSVTRLFGFKTASPSAKANSRRDFFGLGFDSSSEVSMASSMFSYDASSHDYAGLLNEIKELITEQSKLRKAMQEQMESLLEIAKARYASGNKMGAILSMKRVFTASKKKAYISGARFQLIQIRQDLEAEMNSESDGSIVDISDKCNDVKEIKAKLEDAMKIIASGQNMPKDDELLAELKNIMKLEEM